MKKYVVTTKTEQIIITANSDEQLRIKVDCIKSFAEVVSVERLIAVV